MRTIRRSAFETNSSSSHSISIVGGEYQPDALTVENGVCQIHTGEFGWGYDKFCCAPEKAAYCLTWLKGGYAGEHAAVAEEMLRRVVMQVTGAERKEHHVAGDRFEIRLDIQKAVEYREGRYA